MITITGIKIVREFLASKRQNIETIFISEGRVAQDIRRIEGMAEEKGLNVRSKSSTEISNLFPGVKVKNGIVATLADFRFLGPKDLIGGEEEEKIVVMLDRIYDPQNLGAIARTAHCFGACGLIIQSRRASTITPSAINASSGALAHIPVVNAVNLGREIAYFKSNGFWVYGTGSKAGEDVDKVEFEKKSLIIFGTEGEGLRKKLREKCDFNIRVPLKAPFDSLNVAVASGVVLYHAGRKKGPISIN